MPSPSTSPVVKHAADFALLGAFGVFMAMLGPYGTIVAPTGVRVLYWLACIVGGGAIGIGIDELLGRRIKGFGWRLAFDCLAMTPPVTVLVWTVSALLLGTLQAPHRYVSLLFQVFIICVPLMTLRLLVWREPKAAAPSDPERDPAETFRKRLSAKRREARLIAVEAEDHYLRVHTDAGDELVTARFSDALQELAAARGFRTHRSWWVAADAIEAVRWRKGRGELQLASGLVVPVSRSNAAALKDAGWF